MVEAKDELIATRTTLLARLKDWGDDSSWQEFFDIYSQLIPLFKNHRKLGSFKHWLLNMSRWRIRDQFRRRKKLSTELPDDMDLDDETGQLSVLVDDKTLDFDAFW